MKEFKDKVIVVTGGARGIGKAIAVEGAKRGMNVVLNDIDPLVCETAKEIEAMGVKCVAQNADISIYENIEALLKLTLDTFGHVDILVNNAGCAVSGAIWKLPKRDIDWITELNFLSHLYGMKIFLPQMIAQGTPCEIVNVESTAGLITSGKATMYHATKAAGVATSESVYIAMKENNYPINVHSVLDECKAILDKTMAEFGRCDVLVNNAGVSALSDVEHIPEKDIRWVYETNV